MEQQCRRCNSVKPASEFGSERANRDGLKPYCRPCMAAKARDRRTNPEVKARNAAYDKAYRAANPERLAEWAKSPQRLAKSSEWRRKPEVKLQMLINQHAQLARDHGVFSDFTVQDWLDLLEEFDHACAYCHKRDTRMEIEHMTPLSRGGANHRDNVVPACRSCNSRKSSRTLLEFAGLQTRREAIAARRMRVA